MESTPLQERQKAADEIGNLKKNDVQPKSNHIKQARIFHKVLCNKGFSARDKACVIQALMDMARGKIL